MPDLGRENKMRRADVFAVVSSRPKSLVFLGHMYRLIFCIRTDGFPEHHPPLKYVCGSLDGDPKAHSSNWKLLQVSPYLLFPFSYVSRNVPVLPSPG
ncbi:hypothetical protein ROHU_025742 [Labeo rohita]|uniref:Uncharacterized protein n=1 Tax=Labeo rohita TaxID=84645 RepID=A0A498MQU9_LABRO|nr:hypothetical protein ROHU_025742 [Labeo rohita]